MYEVPAAFNPGALLGSSFLLDDGVCVRLRLARSTDVPLIRSLLARHGTRPEELELAALVHFDPRRRLIICATALIDATETLVGVGAIDLDGGEPEIVIVDTEHDESLTELLTAALVGRAGTTARARAA